MSAPCRLMIADDHPTILAGLRAILGAHDDFTVVGEAADGEAAVELWDRLSPDMAFLDLRMPKLDGIEATARIRANDPDARVVILTTFVGDDDIYRALRAGARGYLPKDVGIDNIVSCVRVIQAGGSYLPAAIGAKIAARVLDDTLTQRENDVLAHVARGWCNKRIASQLNIGEGTVKTHLKHILAKLGARSRTEAVAIAQRRGILHL
jgi:two-component system, NarL family, response regulator